MGGIVRKRIDELARGRFACTEPMIAFSGERVELQVLEGKNCQGEFEIKSENNIPLRGKVYSSSPRMECLTSRFEGNAVRIRYEFHSEGLIEGDIQKGDFFIVCNQAEYNLSFVVTVIKPYADTCIGAVRNLHDFTRLAQEGWEEARKVFYSPFFKNILGEKERGKWLLYEGLAKGIPTDLNMEEFLFACGCKQKILCSADENNVVFHDVKEQLKHHIILQKNTWGYIELSITSDASFIKPEKSKITTEDFVGSVCEVNYFILPQEMHSGKNYASLMLKNVNQQITLNICASREPAAMEGNPTRQEIKKCQSKLVNLYIDFRLKKMVTGAWAKASIRVLDELVVKKPGEVWYRLMKAQIFFMNGQRQETEWILSEFKREWKDKKSPEWGYYLYICTLMEREESFADKMVMEIEDIYRRHSDNIMLFWCLLLLRKEYAEDNFRKLKILEYRILEGSKSPFLYVESYCLFLNDPYLLSHLGEFELKIFHWARKYKALTKELAEQLLTVMPERMEYSRMMMLLLENCYALIQDEEALGAVCSFLIKNQKYGKRFFPWYERGVMKKLRMTGLYEAYVMSMDPRSVMEVPRIILMYFKYNSQLEYRMKAVLYVNIIANKEKNPKDYEQYRQAMEVFAYEQMEEGHIDDNLAVVYNEVAKEGVHSTKLAEVLSNVAFYHKLTCLDKNAFRVIVTDSAQRQQQIVPVIKGCAYFKLYSNEYSVFVEDHRGNRYSQSISYQLEKLMYPSKYLRDCMKYAPDSLPFILFYFSGRRAVEYFSEEDLDYFRIVMNDERVSDSMQAWLCAKMIRLLHAMGNTGEINLYLGKIDYGKMTGEEQAYLLETLTGHELYDHAYRLGSEYGWERCSLPGFAKCVSHQIKSLQYEENERLLKYAGEVFFKGEYDAVITEYLCRYYEGSTKAMEAVWKAAGELGVLAHGLEERILVQMLYTTEFIDSAADIYESYEKEGDKKLKKAYLNYFSYYNFVKDMVPPAHLFEKLRKIYGQEGNLPTVCELALLRYLAEEPACGMEEEKLIEAILQKYLYQGTMFAFYDKFSDKIKKQYQIYDKSFVEYKSHPHRKVQIRYKSRDNQDVYVTEDMTEMYEGIYVKEFILFYGEGIQYYISEKTEGEMITTESGMVLGKAGEGEADKGRYGKLNELLFLRGKGESRKLAAKMQQYRNLQEKTQETFTVM